MSGTDPARTGSAPGGQGGEPKGATRLVGLDIARALAVVGMLMVHVGPARYTGLAGTLYALPYGRASVLFVLLAGVGISLFARSGRGLAEVRRRLLWRALVLFPLGLWLQSLNHRVLVILQVYAVLFLLAGAVLGWRDGQLVRLALGSVVIGPKVFLWGRMHAPGLFDEGPIRWIDPPLKMVVAVLAGGPYPVLVWAAPLLVGMWLGRRELRDVAVRESITLWGLVTAGGAALVSALLQVWLVPQPDPPTWEWLVVDVPHSQMPLWMVESTGLAVAALGICLQAADRMGRRLWPLTATGQMALSVYVGHLILLDRYGPLFDARTAAQAIPRAAVLVLLAIAFATLWRARFARGPVEALVRLPALLSGRRMSGTTPKGDAADGR